MKKRTAWVLAAGVAAVAIGTAAVGAVALVLRGRGAPSLGGSNYLVLNLDAGLPEESASELAPFFERQPPTLRTVVDSIDRAAGDARVKAIVLRVSFLPDAGWGKVQELRDAIGRFRKAGKPAYAHLEYSGNKEYYLATACDKVFVVPTALLDVSGLATEVTFFRGTLDKLGVQAQFEGVGKYKNAPNQFTETGFTEPHREQMEALVDSFYAQYTRAISESRGKTPEETQAALDAGPYDGESALAAGLVDELVYEDELRDRLDDADEITPTRYAKGARGFGFDGRAKMALVYVVGEILPGESQDSPFGGSFAGSDTVAHALRNAREDDDVKAVILRVDSPGGSGTASDVIWREVELTRKEKPVIASMGDMAASGGYYVAMGTDAIVAQPATITGSIGVFGGKFSMRGLYDKIGISRELIKRGQHADLFDTYRPWNDEERAHVHRMMAAFYERFVTKAAEGRKMSYEDVDAVAQGRVWTGTEALAHGLVDRVGGLDVALALAKEKAKIPAGQDVRLVVLPEKKGLFETLLERQEEGLEAVLPADVRGLLRWMTAMRHGQPMARLPFELRVR